MTAHLSLPDFTNVVPNAEWASLPLFDRSGWKRLRFGDFAQSVNERVEPADAAEEIYVGLDDLDSCSLHIRRWGKGSDVIGTKLRFQKGDIIFGRRRAYQRKLSIAEVGGICSAHAMVVRAKPNMVLPEFLPFLMMSDRFMNRAVEISVGSLSPTINWTALKLEEFDLPPLDQQQLIAGLLVATDETIQKTDAFTSSIVNARAILVEEHFDRYSGTKLDTRRLETVAEVNYGITLGGYRKALPIERPYLRVANVQRATFNLGEIKTINCTESEIVRFELIAGDVLIVEGHANVAEIGRSAVWHSHENGMLHQNHLLRARCSTLLLPEYLNLCINSEFGKRYFRSKAKSSSGLNTINSTVVKQFSIPVTAISVQKALLSGVKKFDDLLRSIDAKQVALNKLLREILNTIS